MPRGPWYVSARAVREYLALTGRPPVDDGPVWDEAEDELIDIAERTVAADRRPRVLRSGLVQYRGPRPLRLRLIVAPKPRAEGSLPQLVQVLPEHEWQRRDR